MQDFRQLKVWEKAHVMTLCIYKVTSDFPKTEHYGQVNQMRRSAASIACNNAEGCGRGSDQDFARFLQMALGSSCELEYQSLLAKDLGWLQPIQSQSDDLLNYESIQDSVTEIKRMLTSFIQKLKA